MGTRLSTGAELLLVAIDPAKGGLLRRRRRRFRRALAAADGRPRGIPLAGWRARRRAHQELERAGLLDPGSTAGRPRLADRKARAAVVQRVRRCIADRTRSEPRDRELLLLLAWSGLLGSWLSRDERRLALRRLQGGQAPMSEAVTALGAAGVVATEELFAEAGFGDFGGGEAAGLEPGAASEGSGTQ